MAIDMFIMATMCSFLAFTAIFIYAIVLKKKWNFLKLRRIMRKMLLAFFILGFINIIISNIIKSIFNSINIGIDGIVSLALSTIIAIFIFRFALRYNKFEERNL